MTKFRKCSPYRHEGCSSILNWERKGRGRGAVRRGHLFAIPVLGRQRQGDPSVLPGSLVCEFQVSKKYSSKSKGVGEP